MNVFIGKGPTGLGKAIRKVLISGHINALIVLDGARSLSACEIHMYMDDTKQPLANREKGWYRQFDKKVKKK
ncbi:MAG: hypothetical protein V7733_10325 [Paraglaciecola polaris]|uniref:hypothetical protein n=1 Tax=Paraglaciecola polaris TaxID=222814 RepID=UPI00300339DB